MISDQIQAVFRGKGLAPSAVVQALGNDTLQVSCDLQDESNVETVMGMIPGWQKKSETRVGSKIFKTYKNLSANKDL
jgi:translation initiation factor IF-1